MGKQEIEIEDYGPKIIELFVRSFFDKQMQQGGVFLSYFLLMHLTDLGTVFETMNDIVLKRCVCKVISSDNDLVRQ